MTTHAENKLQPTRPGQLTREVWPFDINTVEVDSAAIAYTDEGSGPVLLLVHDGMWSFVWGQLIERLRSDFRVVALDFPGAGLSPSSGRDPGLEADSRLLEEFADALGLTDLTLAVHDLGGTVGLGFAARRPELVSGLVLINTFGWPPHTASLRAMLRVVSSRWFTAINVATNLVPRLTATSGGLGRHLDRQSRRAFLAGFDTKDRRRRFHKMMGAPAQETAYLEQVERALATVLSNTPALTIYGEKNDPFGFQAKFAKALSNVDEMVIPKGNHFPMADDPEGVADRIRRWHHREVAAD